ncbi:MAG: hypothetical protein ABJL67_00010, partial [Sulfitobacter sp.]
TVPTLIAKISKCMTKPIKNITFRPFLEPASFYIHLLSYAVGEEVTKSLEKVIELDKRRVNLRHGASHCVNQRTRFTT